MKKRKILHILIIFIGIIIILIPSLHKNIWFDESYSVAIAKHGFIDIWKITAHDVHPPLYYWMLHIIYLIFKDNIIVFRLFSTFAIIILGILGYTHIRKDFGKKAGILFSLFSFFTPIIGYYSQEIRMYSWSCLIVTLMGIYAYRLYKKIEKQSRSIKKEIILFGLFGICSCYIHYYALVTIGFVNLFFVIYLIKNRVKRKSYLTSFILLFLIQLIIYIPWLLCFYKQVKYVNNNFWISIKPLDTIIEIISFQFKRQINNKFIFDIETAISLIISIFVNIYLIYKIINNCKKMKPAILSLLIYSGVIFIVTIISLKIPILFPRYLFVITGFYIFSLSYIISKEKNKWIKAIIITIIVILTLISSFKNLLINYNKCNMKQIEYLKERIKKEDIILYKDYAVGGVIAVYFKDNIQFYYNSANWKIDEAYKAYKPCMNVIYDCDSVLEDSYGRIWVIDSNDNALCNEILKSEKYKINDYAEFKTKYQNYVYKLTLLIKDNE